MSEEGWPRTLFTWPRKNAHVAGRSNQVLTYLSDCSTYSKIPKLLDHISSFIMVCCKHLLTAIVSSCRCIVYTSDPSNRNHSCRILLHDDLRTKRSQIFGQDLPTKFSTDAPSWQNSAAMGGSMDETKMDLSRLFCSEQSPRGHRNPAKIADGPNWVCIVSLRRDRFRIFDQKP